MKNNRGPDLKKKMKKSGSIKRQELDTMRKNTKPPQPCSAAGTPNYMKPTTSSDARKEVSTKTPPDNSNFRRKSSNSSKITLTSANNKTSGSKKTMRTLTKNPSFKPSRAFVRKCPPVVLVENLDAQRATCSSTLKDSKFPAYLSLNHGGTESEGTSAIKVCPYTYCSLNGHHHNPLPPLKCFLSARRRMIKTQRNVKLGCLSPRRVKGVVGDSGPVFDEKIGMNDDLESSIVSPIKDFFIEIYSKKNEDEEEGVLGGPICYEVDTNETCGQEGDVNSMDIGEKDLIEQNEEVKVDEESRPNVGFDEISSDMEWETQEIYHSALHLDYDYEYEYEYSPETEAAKVESHIIYDEFIIKSDKNDGRFDDECLLDEASQESFDEEGFSSDSFSNSDDGEFTGLLQNLNDMENSSPVEIPAQDEPDTITNNSASSQNSTEQVHQIQSEPSDENQEVVQLKSAEMVNKAKAKNKAETETEDSSCALLLAIAKRKKPIEDVDESGQFNPRAPNFLPLEPDQEAEKVELKHQDLDEKKNAEEWMVDYALRQVVTKLGPARKKKVALLVEAFEKVMPITKCELQLRHTSVFDQARPMQACG
ncbi:hypothetical protein DH2020_023545 [Rehmannia glutinosa]|uniref:Calmodulin-binding domain-containing protein n=1 Tax=Rehmannia glutinosa TaxID=99300 RepID=A0ABR0W765_REHGL